MITVYQIYQKEVDTFILDFNDSHHILVWVVWCEIVLTYQLSMAIIIRRIVVLNMKHHFTQAI